MSRFMTTGQFNDRGQSVQIRHGSDSDYMYAALETGNVEPFASYAQFMEAVASPQYDQDPLYRGMCDARCFLLLQKEQAEAEHESELEDGEEEPGDEGFLYTNGGKTVTVNPSGYKFHANESRDEVEHPSAGVTRVNIRMDSPAEE